MSGVISQRLLWSAVPWLSTIRINTTDDEYSVHRPSLIIFTGPCNIINCWETAICWWSSLRICWQKVFLANMPLFTFSAPIAFVICPQHRPSVIVWSAIKYQLQLSSSDDQPGTISQISEFQRAVERQVQCVCITIYQLTLCPCQLSKSRVRWKTGN